MYIYNIYYIYIYIYIYLMVIYIFFLFFVFCAIKCMLKSIFSLNTFDPIFDGVLEGTTRQLPDSVSAGSSISQCPGLISTSRKAGREADVY